MKKTIMALSVAIVALTFASCKNGAAVTNNASPFVDSFSTIAAQVNGAMFAQNIKTLPQNDQDRFNKDEFLRGLKDVYLTDTANLSYILGLQIGINMLQQQRQMDQVGVSTNRSMFFDNFAKYFKKDSVPADQLDALQTQYQKLQAQAQEIMSKRQEEMQAEAQKKMEAENAANSEAGKKFVEEQKAKDAAIKTTESGLSYKVLQEGTGAKATDTDRVKVKYTGKLIDGTVFDSNDSTTFTTRNVVPGFAEALKMMNKGSKMTVYIPAELGYGERGAGEKIAPGSTLVFDIEVLDVIPVPAAKK